MLLNQIESTQKFQVWLQKEFSEKCRKNPRYSLRAFARLLEMDASSVSQILSGKRRVSHKVLHKVCDRLSTPPTVREQLSTVPKNPRKKHAPAFHELAADAFAVMADWYHYAILELTYTKDFQSNPAWIARKLGISATEASVAIQRLERLDLLAWEKNRLVKTQAFLTNYHEGFTAPAQKELQRQLLQKALHAVDHTPQEAKDITSITMAIDPKKIPAAKEKIKKFRRSLCKFLSDGSDNTRVYNLNLQLFPLSDFSTNGDSYE